MKKMLKKIAISLCSAVIALSSTLPGLAVNAADKIFSWPVPTNIKISTTHSSNKGVDFACSTGTNVYSIAANGKVVTVVDTGCTGSHRTEESAKKYPCKNGNNCPAKKLTSAGNGSYANYVVIEYTVNDVKYYCLYAHLLTGSISVKEGDTVSAGQQVAKTGVAGNVTGPHLHFEIRKTYNNYNYNVKVSDYITTEPLQNSNNFLYDVDKSTLQALIWDADFYYRTNPDLQSRYGYDPVALYDHFNRWGKAEGRAPSIFFDPSFYKNMYSDLASRYKDDNVGLYNHFIDFGFWEGRQGSQFFSITFYSSNNSDVVKAKGARNGAGIMMHYITNGINDLRDGSAEFSLSQYKKNNKDLQRAFGNNNRLYIIHYITNGKKEGRKAT